MTVSSNRRRWSPEVIIAMTAILACSQALPAAGPVWLSRPGYVAADARADWPAGWDSFDKGAWAKARRIERFSSLGASEADDRLTEVRMLRSGTSSLTVFVRCHEPQPDKIKKGLPASESYQEDSVELLLVAAADGRFIRVAIDAGGLCAGERQIIPSSVYGKVVAEPLEAGLIKSAAGLDARGYWVIVELPLDKLGLARDKLQMNILRNRSADGTVFSWVDLWGGRARNVHRTGRVHMTGDAQGVPSVELPAAMSVGSNSLKLSGWRDGFVLQACGKPVTVDANGVATIDVAHQGPVEISICRAGEVGQEVAGYSCDVRRPVMIQAQAPFIEQVPAVLVVAATLDVAGTSEIPLTIEAWQGDKKVGQSQVKVPAGLHKLEIPLQGAQAGEIKILASAEVTIGGKKQSLTGRHWCTVGTSAKQVDRFRDGIEKMPTRPLIRAAVCDAGEYWRLVQKGDGSFTSAKSPWPQGIAYLMAVMYKTDWPENAHHKDERFLASAAGGMESLLDPSDRQEWLNHPDNRSLQAMLLTYEILKNDVPPEQALRWKTALLEIVQAVVDTWLLPAQYRMTRYSADVGTGTNHWAFHAANVYSAGRIFGRKDWLELGSSQMRQLARQEADGQFAERRGVPTLAYNWLTQTAVIEYFLQSADSHVEPTVRRCGEFAWRSNIRDGMQLTLHDGRVNSGIVGRTFPLAMTIAPQGRHLGRTCLLSQIAGHGPSSMTPEAWHRWAELAVALDALKDWTETPGPDEDEFAYMDGKALIVKRKAFSYGLSAISLPPIKDQLYRLDPQNAFELYHSRAGNVLLGNNSQDQPEAGSFFRKVGGKSVWLPADGDIVRTQSGHAATLTFDGFTVRLEVSVLSENSAQVKVELLEVEGGDPVLFNFFPPGPEAQLSADKLEIRSGLTTITASSPLELQKDFKIFHPYTGKYQMQVKPVRAYVALDKARPILLNVKVEEAGQ